MAQALVYFVVLRSLPGATHRLCCLLDLLVVLLLESFITTYASSPVSSGAIGRSDPSDLRLPRTLSITCATVDFCRLLDPSTSARKQPLRRAQEEEGRIELLVKQVLVAHSSAKYNKD